MRGSIPARDGIFPGRDLKLALQAPGVIGSAMGLVGPVSVTGWGRKLDLQLLSQCGSTHDCLSRSFPEIH